MGGLQQQQHHQQHQSRRLQQQQQQRWRVQIITSEPRVPGLHKMFFGQIILFVPFSAQERYKHQYFVPSMHVAAAKKINCAPCCQNQKMHSNGDFVLTYSRHTVNKPMKRRVCWQFTLNIDCRRTLFALVASTCEENKFTQNAVAIRVIAAAI